MNDDVNNDDDNVNLNLTVSVNVNLNVDVDVDVDVDVHDDDVDDDGVDGRDVVMVTSTAADGGSGVGPCVHCHEPLREAGP